MQDVDEETKHDHDRHQMKSNRDLEETPIFELTVTFDGYHKPVVYPLQDVKAIFHAYPSLEEPSEVFLDQNAANKYVRITSACVNAFEHIMHHYATEDRVRKQMSKEHAEQFCVRYIESKYETGDTCISFVMEIMMNELTITDEEKACLDEISSMEKAVLTRAETKIMWKHRYRCLRKFCLLKPFLDSVKWGSHEHASEARCMLHHWEESPFPEDALFLLGIKYSDPIVRAFAVVQLGRLEDKQLYDYVLQLVQCLKLENNDDSTLLRFLLRRGLRNPYVIGHYLYWYIKSELHVKQFSRRFSLLLELYVMHCGQHREHLIQQQHVVQNLLHVTRKVLRINKKDGKKRTDKLREALKNCKWPESFETCISPKQQCCGVIVEKCKVMDSKQAPLWIEFKNSDCAENRTIRESMLGNSTVENVKVIFKVGDDLRQDQITCSSSNREQNYV